MDSLESEILDLLSLGPEDDIGNVEYKRKLTNIWKPYRRDLLMSISDIYQIIKYVN